MAGRYSRVNQIMALARIIGILQGADEDMVASCAKEYVELIAQEKVKQELPFDASDMAVYKLYLLLSEHPITKQLAGVEICLN